MYLSTNEYLQALRRGDYLSALGWFDFLEAKYTEPQSYLACDKLINLAVFELITQDFSPEDLPQIEILYALVNEEIEPFRGKSAYAGMIFCSAAIQCLVYQEQGLVSFYQMELTTNVAVICDWMQRESELFTITENKIALTGKLTALDAKLLLNVAQTKEIRKNINRLMAYQLEIRNYLKHLDVEKGCDHLAAQRFDLVHQLLVYLNEQTMISTELTDRLSNDISTLRFLQPFTWESSILDQLCPRTYFRWFLDSSVQTLGFFSSSIRERWQAAVASSSEPGPGSS